MWLSVALMKAMKTKSYSFRRSFRLSDGSSLSGAVNEAWFQNGALPRPMIITLDLKSAYKQLALNELEARKSVICLKCLDRFMVLHAAHYHLGQLLQFCTSIGLPDSSEQFSLSVVSLLAIILTTIL